MDIFKLLLLVCAFMGVQPEAVADNINKPISMQFGKQVIVKSKVLRENRNIIIHLPSGYAKTEKNYPVLYLLDGERHLYHSVIASELLNKAKQIPELIIVAITNNEGMRQRDLNTESEKFTLYLSSEVITYVDNNYRTTGSNTLFGHSLAGFYTVDLLANAPLFFENYIAASPPLEGDDIELYSKIVAPTNAHEVGKKTLYFTLGSKKEEGEDVANAMNNFVKLLGESSPQGFDWHYQFLDGETHITTSYLTLFEGIRYVFKK
ncbi:MAG: alpha/beta hydrolase-fold protein [Paraglaciecola sp.]|uniref:alpha/beta hydrolase n=3 Tax=Paraglaciecola sp. TaxID=1920173 RepID=UPI0032670C1A